MNPYEVTLFCDGNGACWVEIMNGGRQEGADIDFSTHRQGLYGARRECKRLGLDSFNEYRTHQIAVGRAIRRESVR
jgi:hypothetical protein